MQTAYIVMTGLGIALLALLGEWAVLARARARVPTRVLVTGTRGKSSVVRLIHAKAQPPRCTSFLTENYLFITKHLFVILRRSRRTRRCHPQMLHRHSTGKLTLSARLMTIRKNAPAFTLQYDPLPAEKVITVRKNAQPLTRLFQRELASQFRNRRALL